MKKILAMAVGLAAVVSVAQAEACPEANYDGCGAGGYSIVETEPDTYWLHNEMEAAHWVGYHRHTRKIVHHVRRHVRRHVHHRVHHRHLACR